MPDGQVPGQSLYLRGQQQKAKQQEWLRIQAEK